MLATRHAVTIEDIEYLRHGDRGLTMRLFKPKGDGLFASVIDLHGGAWNNNDLSECQARAEMLASHGLVVAALDFRHGADGYPTSLMDINYATRLVKARAKEFQTAADRVGVMGSSSGGHLGMLAAMRPADARYGALPLPAGSPAVDASLRCVVMLWPVINPISRYRYAKRLNAGPDAPAWTKGMAERHERYWGNEGAMIEGNPMLALERGETLVTPPAMWVQGQPDVVHDYKDADSSFAGNEPERFAHNYRKAGGQIELVYCDQAARATEAAFERVAGFFHRHMPAPH